MSKLQWLDLARRLALLSGTTRCERAILANVLAGRLDAGDRRCLLAMRDRHPPQPTKASNHPTLKIDHRRLRP